MGNNCASKGGGEEEEGRLVRNHVHRCHSNPVTIILFLASSSKSS